MKPKDKKSILIFGILLVAAVAITIIVYGFAADNVNDISKYNLQEIENSAPKLMEAYNDSNEFEITEYQVAIVNDHVYLYFDMKDQRKNTEPSPNFVLFGCARVEKNIFGYQVTDFWHSSYAKKEEKDMQVSCGSYNGLYFGKILDPKVKYIQFYNGNTFDSAYRVTEDKDFYIAESKSYNMSNVALKLFDRNFIFLGETRE